MSEPANQTPTQRLISMHARRSFGPGFADRVMARVAADGSGFENLLLLQFRRFAIAGALTVVLLAAVNLLGRSARADQTVVEALLGLEPVTVTSLYPSSYSEPAL